MDATVVIAVVASMVAGFLGGWLLRGPVVRWCSMCGRLIGSMCIACTHAEIRERELTGHTAECTGMHRRGAAI